MNALRTRPLPRQRSTFNRQPIVWPPAKWEGHERESVRRATVAREIQELYSSDAPKDLNALFEVQMGVLKTIREMGPA